MAPSIQTCLPASMPICSGSTWAMGSITRMHRSIFLLRVFSDACYPGIIEECASAMSAVLPRNEGDDCTCVLNTIMVISSSSKHWPCIFPQHGPGVKHTRKIRLAFWQETMAQGHPEALLRGLIHSDGCRVLNRVQKRKYAYPRYQFSQVSDDIPAFTDSCDQLGISVAAHESDERLHRPAGRRCADGYVRRPEGLALFEPERFRDLLERRHVRLLERGQS